MLWLILASKPLTPISTGLVCACQPCCLASASSLASSFQILPRSHLQRDFLTKKKTNALLLRIQHHVWSYSSHYNTMELEVVYQHQPTISNPALYPIKQGDRMYCVLVNYRYSLTAQWWICLVGKLVLMFYSDFQVFLCMSSSLLASVHI